MKKLLVWCILIVLLLSGCGANPDSTENRGGLDEESVTTADTQQDTQEQVPAWERVYTVPDFTAVEDEHTVTMMIYMVGSDLESKGGAATNDMAEMIASGIDLDKVNLLVYAGGSSKWFSDISDTENNIYRLTGDGFTEVKKFTQKSMGDPNSLTEFLDYAYKNYTSDTYNLILWDHGNGPVMGYGKDKLFDGDSLTLPEIKTALSDSPFNQNNKLGFIGFDACLMASAELACTLKDYAQYMISSQEVEPNFGWNYAFLEKCGKVNELSLAQCIVTEFVNYCEDYFEEHENFCADITLSVVDLQYAGELESEINKLFDKAVNDVTGGYSELAIERYKTKALGRATSGSEYDLVDVSNLMETMAEKYPDETGRVKSVLDKMIVADGYNTEDCCGMSMYYPYFNKKHYSKSWKESYAQIGLFDSYIKYLGRYEQIWLGTEMSEFFMEPMTPEEYTPGVYSLKLNSDQLEHFLAAGFYILKKYGDGVYCSISYSRDVSLENDTLMANYDGRTIMVSDDFGNKKILPSVVTDVRGDRYYHTIYHKARNRFFTDSTYYSALETVPAQSQLVVDHSNYQVEVDGFYLRTELMDSDNPVSDDSTFYNGSDMSGEAGADNLGNNGEVEYIGDEEPDDFVESGKMFPLDVNKYMVFSLAMYEPKYPTRDDKGILLPYDEWKSSGMRFYDSISLENGMYFSYEPYYADGSEYFLMFDVVDTQNNHYSSELMPIALAQAPEMEEAVYPVNEYDWTEGELSPAIEDGNVTIQLFEAKTLDEVDKEVYGLYIVNNNDYPVMLDVEDISINGEYQIKDTENNDIPSHQARSLILPKLEQTMRFAGYDSLKNLSFSYNLTNGFTGKFMTTHGGVKINIADEISPQIICIHSMGAKADRQMLVDNDEISIELLDLGHFLGNGSVLTSILQGRFRFVNKTGAVYRFSIPNIYVNGICFETYGTTKDIGESGEDYVHVHLGDMGKGTPFDEINSISFKCVVNENINEATTQYMCDVDLSALGKGANINLSDYECIYEDENIKVYDGGLTYDKCFSENPLYRAMLIQNVSGDDLYYLLNEYDENSDEYKQVGFNTIDIIGKDDIVMRSFGSGFTSSNARANRSFVIGVYDRYKDAIFSIVDNYEENYTTPVFELKDMKGR